MPGGKGAAVTKKKNTKTISSASANPSGRFSGRRLKPKQPLGSPVSNRLAHKNLIDSAVSKRVPVRRRKTPQHLTAATSILKAISNQRRLMILRELSHYDELSVKELEDILQNISQSALSQHLGRLRRAQLVKTRRDSQQIFYSIRGEEIQELLNTLDRLYKA